MWDKSPDILRQKEDRVLQSNLFFILFRNNKKKTPQS